MTERSELIPEVTRQLGILPEYLTPPEAAAFTRLAVQTLAKMRCAGGGPQFVKICRRVVYPRVSLQAWMDARVRSSTSDRA